MKTKNSAYSIFSIFIAGFLAGLVGIYTENSGFLVAGGIFILVGLILGINRILGTSGNNR